MVRVADGQAEAVAAVVSAAAQTTTHAAIAAAANFTADVSAGFSAVLVFIVSSAVV